LVRWCQLTTNTFSQIESNKLNAGHDVPPVRKLRDQEAGDCGREGTAERAGGGGTPQREHHHEVLARQACPHPYPERRPRREW
jgi:hypothetical protein